LYGLIRFALCSRADEFFFSVLCPKEAILWPDTNTIRKYILCTVVHQEVGTCLALPISHYNFSQLLVSASLFVLVTETSSVQSGYMTLLGKAVFSRFPKGNVHV
jgi:hypothetical protein